MCSASLLGLTETRPERRGASGRGAVGGKDGVGSEFGIGGGSGSSGNSSENDMGSLYCDHQTTGSRMLMDQLYG